MAQALKKPSKSKLVRFLFRNKMGATGMVLILFIILSSILAPLFTSHSHLRRSGMPHESPGSKHIMGTTKMGKDVFSQVLHGGRISLTVGFTAGIIATLLGVLVGVTSGYIGGKTDEVMMFFTNIILVIPGMPLLIVIASYFEQANPFVIGLVLSITGWAYSARVYRTQTMTLKNREFVMAAELMGEKKWRIILVEIMPNMLSLIAGGFVGVTIWFILAEAGLEFIGLGDPGAVTWGTMLYWGQKNSALDLGAWWEILFPSIAIMLTGASLVLINFTVDEITNPQLRTLKGFKKLKAALKQKKRIEVI